MGDSTLAAFAGRSSFGATFDWCRMNDAPSASGPRLDELVLMSSVLSGCRVMAVVDVEFVGIVIPALVG